MVSTTSSAAAMDETPRILLLAPMPIGDTLFCSPTIRTLRATYPDARITAVAHSATASLLRNMPGVNDVLILPTGKDWGGPLALVMFLRRLRAARFDISVDFSSPAYKWISLLAGVPVRTYMKFDRFWWFVPGRHVKWRRTHAAEHYYDSARELALPHWSEVSHVPHISLPVSARKEARRFLSDHGLARVRTPIVAIHPGGAMLDGVKRWPAENYAAVADALHDHWGAHILLVGGPDEQQLVREGAHLMRSPSVQVAGAVSLLGSFALLTAADLFIGNDSGLLHAAAALGTPYIGIYGPTAAANFHPLPQRERQGIVLRPQTPCLSPRYFVGGDVVWSRPCCQGVCQALASISAERVTAVASMLLQRRLSGVEVVS